MKTPDPDRMISASLRCFAAALAAALGLTNADAAIAVGASGSAVQTFDTQPLAADWATLTWGGTGGELIDAAAVDAAVQALTAAGTTTRPSTSGTIPPSSNALPRQNTTLLALQSRPTSAVKGCVMMAKLSNTSGGGIDQLEISYDYRSAAGVAGVAGLRAYYSLTGLADSWTVIPALCGDTPGALSTVVTLSSTWADATEMYVLWVDDNSAASGDDSWTTIDNVWFGKSGTGARFKTFDFGLPAYGAAKIAGTDITLDVPDGTDVSALTPTFTLASGAGCDKASGSSQDFSSSSQTYTVTPAAGSAVDYTVTVNFRTVVDLSNTLTPWEPANTGAGVRPNNVVGTTGNFGRLVGETKTHWGSGGFSCPLLLNGNTLRIDSGGGNAMNVSGAISGDGVMIFQAGGSGTMRLQGRTGNTYTGTTSVTDAKLSLEKISGDALRGPITLSSSSSKVTWAASHQVGDTSNITLTNAAASLDLAGFTDTINELRLITGNTVQTGVGGVLKVSKLFLNGAEQPEVAKIAGDGFVLGSGYIEVGASGPPVIADPPAVPATPVPADGATTIHPAVLTKLDWADSSGATSYDVYFWPASGSKPGTPNSNVAISEYTLSSQVLSLTSYKWQVVAKNVAGNTNGPEWTFSTIDRTQVPGNYSEPYSDATHNLDFIVGVGNSATLLGNFRVHWSGASGKFTVPVNTNGFTLDADTGGGNSGHFATGPISGGGNFVITHGPASTAWDNLYTINGTLPNTYTGGTSIKRGTILMSKTAGVDALPPTSITLGMAGDTARLVWGANNQVNDLAEITVLLPTVSVAAPDANLNFLNLAGYSDTIASLVLPDDGTKTQVRTGAGGVLTVGSLTVNGETKGPGTYTSSNSTFVTGTGSVVVPDPYASWIDDYPLTGDDTLPGSNPDGDPYVNLLEHAFGLNPAVFSSGSITWSGGAVTGHGGPTTQVTNIPNGVDFRAVFGRRKNYVTAGLTYTVQFSADLAEWVDSTATPEVLATDGEIDAVSVPYPLFISTTAGVVKPQYFRVMVNTTPGPNQTP